MRYLFALALFIVIFTLYTVEASVGLFPSSPGFKCNPGRRWADACNFCVCNDDNIAVCTEKACV